ncbi:hypothetical protein ABZY44_25130 [Streptomyces sp. NPDC006544]|uniref:hypothetical protein n=1 Tax=Streptomyces sp. NPDC006544 TaxID=3154583 RepID=UPI0033BDB5AD
MRRWTLPLLLAALLTAPGCVTIHPTPLPHPDTRAPAAADHKHPAGPLPARPVTGTALPLSPLPAPAPAAPAGAAPAQDHGPGPTAADHASTGQARHTLPTPRRTAGPGPVRPNRAIAPKRAPRPAGKPKAKAKARPNHSAQTPHRPARPAPGTGAGSGDMRELCRAAHGITSPAIASLCHQTYR